MKTLDKVSGLGGEAENIGRFLQDVRERKALSQSTVAERAHITQSELSKIERGKHLPNLDTLRRIVAALGETPLGIRALWAEIGDERTSVEVTPQDLKEGQNFDHAKEEAKRLMYEGNLFHASKKIAVMERLAKTLDERVRAGLYAGYYAREAGFYADSDEYFREAVKALTDVDEKSVLWDMYYVNHASVLTYTGNLPWAEMLLDKLMARNPGDNFYHRWGVFERGRLALAREDAQKAKALFKSAIHHFDECREKDERLLPCHLGYFQLFLAKSMLTSDEEKEKACMLLQHLMECWGPDENRPRNAEIYAEAALEYGLATNKEAFLEKAKDVAKKNGLIRIVRIVQKHQPEDENRNNPKDGASRVPIILSSLAFFLLFSYFVLLPLAQAMCAIE